MKYFEFTFHTTPHSEAVNDVLSALLAEIGFETFVTDEKGQLQAYVQQTLFAQESLDDTLQNFPLPDTQITYTREEPADLNWNETWENEGFEPIYVDRRLVVCDTRHEAEVARTGSDMRKILIHPRQAFGTGSHQTTRMILSTLLDMQLTGKRVIDAGCGTGILGFMSLMQGASQVLAYDIDEWSVQNTLDNAALNQLDTSHLQVLHGDASVLDALAGADDSAKYDLLIANINRNILLADMPRFMASLKPSAQLLFSGFYVDDIPYLTDATAPYGYQLKAQRQDGEWAMLLMG